MKSQDNNEFPQLNEILPRFESSPREQQHFRHNVGIWNCVNGGLHLTETNRLDFEPWPEYWFAGERRMLVSFFSERFHESYAPAEVLRRLSARTFRHFDDARENDRFGDRFGVEANPGKWPELLKSMQAVAQELPDQGDYAKLKEIWPRLTANSLAEDLTEFLREAEKKSGPADVEPGFFKRVPWFPYLGIKDQSDLEARQHFWGGFYLLFTQTNAYRNGGSMSFAPVLGNNPTGVLLDFALRWAAGESPEVTKFEVEGKDERADRSHHNTVIEFYGFLNLHRQPFYNNRALAYAQFAEKGDKTVFPRLQRIGEMTRSFLAENPEMIPKLSKMFREVVSEREYEGYLWMEGISRKTVAKQYPKEVASQVDLKIRRATREAATQRAEELTDEEAAAAAFHLMLDALLYEQSGKEEDSEGTKPTGTKPPDKIGEGGGKYLEATIELPDALQPIANDALAYLRGGFHVLLAGAPGTGKTTIAQVVGHAWNQGHDSVPSQIALAEAPQTTVGNSAWAPFHTIGGILPDGSGQFVAQRGIFIDPDFESTGGKWQLRPECIVLDEMNRADLDRCIGELYPLLSHSVDQVAPAGIPGVKAIRTHRKFRLVATVNDATVDDVVFPISEGLARRFIRIELPGATEEQVAQYLGGGLTSDSGRLTTAREVLSEFYTSCSDQGLTLSSDADEQVAFGVGYFGLLKAWVSKELVMSEEFENLDRRVQARQILETALRSATREKGYDQVFKELAAGEAPQ